MENETTSVEKLIEQQHRCSVSPNPLERVVGSLLMAARLQQKLVALSDKALGHLILTHVWNELNLLSPEMAICQAATERLLGHELGGQMMTAVWERALYIGSLKDAEQLASTNPMEIAAVLSLCPEEIERKSRNIDYLQVPIPDSQPISMRQLEEIMESIEHGLHRGNLLIHCAAGFSRSPIMAAAWMDRCGYLNFEDAVQEIARLRPTIDPSPVLFASVKERLRR